MRILMVALNYAPEPIGIAPYSTGLAEGLALAGHKVSVLTGVPHYPEWRNTSGTRAWRSTETVNGVSLTRIRHYVPPGGTGFRRGLLEVSFALGVLVAPWGKPNMVITVSPSLGASAVVALRGRVCGIPTIVWVQDLYSRGFVEFGDTRAKAAIARRVEGATLRLCEGVVVIHRRFRAYVEETLKVPACKVVEIRNWSHVGQGTIDDCKATREALGWGDRPVVLHSGNMGAKQGLGSVVQTARQAEKDGRDVLFVLMGEGSQRTLLEQQARGCGNLMILPPQPAEVFVAALRAADVLLLNEAVGVREMAVPSKLTTYFAAGKAVVAAVAPDGTSADEVRAAHAGMLVTPGNPHALLEAVEKLMHNRELAAKLARAGQEYARKVLEAQTILDQWLTAVNTIPWCQHEADARLSSSR